MTVSTDLTEVWSQTSQCVYIETSSHFNDFCGFLMAKKSKNNNNKSEGLSAPLEER